jgi:hypothetical protein
MVTSTKEWGGVLVGVRFSVGVWVVWGVGGTVNSMAEDLVQVLSYSAVSSVVSGSVDVILDIVVVSVLVVVVCSLAGVWHHSFGNDLNLWDDVLVEEDGVTEVHLELGNSPELLEEWRLNITSEDGGVLFPELTEEWDLEVFPEEWVGHELFKREDGHPALSPGFNIIVSVVRFRRIIVAAQKVFLWDRETVGVGPKFVLVQKQIVLEERLLF